MVLFCAMVCSIGRVTSCSTSCAVAPGHWQTATATRTGISGSLRCGIEKKPYTPQITTPISAAQAICRCSTKKREVLCLVRISCSSLSCGMACSSGNYVNFLAVVDERSADRNQLLARSQALRHFNLITEGLSDFDDLGCGVLFSLAFVQKHHRETARIARRTNDGAQGHDKPWHRVVCARGS